MLHEARSGGDIPPKNNPELKNISDDQLQERILQEYSLLRTFGVSTSVSAIIEGVKAFGEDYDNMINNEIGEIAATGTNVLAAILDNQPTINQNIPLKKFAEYIHRCSKIGETIDEFRRRNIGPGAKKRTRELDNYIKDHLERLPDTND